MINQNQGGKKFNQKLIKRNLLTLDMAKENNLEKLKKDYAKLQKKYGLPSFKDLNEDFPIDKAAESETDIPIREIRKNIADKMMGYLRFTETLLNPVNAPMFIFSIIKTLGPEEKKHISEIYKKLAKNEIKLIETDVEFSEKKEAEFIKNSYEIWREMKKNILKILKLIEEKWDNKFETGTRGYFG